MDEQAIKRFFEDKGYRVWSGNYGLDVGSEVNFESLVLGVHITSSIEGIRAFSIRIPMRSQFVDFGSVRSELRVVTCGTAGLDPRIFLILTWLGGNTAPRI